MPGDVSLYSEALLVSDSAREGRGGVSKWWQSGERQAKNIHWFFLRIIGGKKKLERVKIMEDVKKRDFSKCL